MCHRLYIKDIYQLNDKFGYQLQYGHFGDSEERLKHRRGRRNGVNAKKAGGGWVWDCTAVKANWMERLCGLGLALPLGITVLVTLPSATVSLPAPAFLAAAGNSGATHPTSWNHSRTCNATQLGLRRPRQR